MHFSLGATMTAASFISLLGGSIALWPLKVNAQQPATPAIGYLGVGLPINKTCTEALRAGLQEFGYVDGKNVLLEFRFAEKPEELHKFAVELAGQSQPAVIVTSGERRNGCGEVSSFQNSDHLFRRRPDPVRLGLVSSLNRSWRSYKQV